MVENEEVSFWGQVFEWFLLVVFIVVFDQVFMKIGGYDSFCIDIFNILLAAFIWKLINLVVESRNVLLG